MRCEEIKGNRRSESCSSCVPRTLKSGGWLILSHGAAVAVRVQANVQQVGLLYCGGCRPDTVIMHHATQASESQTAGLFVESTEA